MMFVQKKWPFEGEYLGSQMSHDYECKLLSLSATGIIYTLVGPVFALFRQKMGAIRAVPNL
jgi:hypothetical protein